MRALLHRHLRDTGQRLAVLVNAQISPATKTFGCSASASVGAGVTRPARSSGTPSDFASGDAALQPPTALSPRDC
jgi:hypothetical protein